MTTIDGQWQFILQRSDERIRQMAEHAVREPLLRRLFAYASMNRLRFSRKVEYPYDEMPYIMRSDVVHTYETRDYDNRPLYQDDLPSAIAALVLAINRNDESPKGHIG